MIFQWTLLDIFDRRSKSGLGKGNSPEQFGRLGSRTRDLCSSQTEHSPCCGDCFIMIIIFAFVFQSFADIWTMYVRSPYLWWWYLVCPFDLPLVRNVVPYMRPNLKKLILLHVLSSQVVITLRGEGKTMTSKKTHPSLQLLIHVLLISKR